ncbi:MAG: histidine kinase [Acidobacteria bacterium]|nr:histidine kinase [Acidobacteriota bacterium]MBV9475932.1 histidine kinase [Acidobacteriota bacterium]
MRETERDYARLSPRELALIFAFWTFLATLSSVNRILDPRGLGFRLMSPAGPIVLAFIESWLWAAFTPAIFWLCSRMTHAQASWLARVTLLIVIGFAVSIAAYVVVDFAREVLLPVRPPRRPPPPGGPLRDILRFRFVNQLLFYMAVLAAGFAREFFLRDQARQRQASVLAAQTATLQAQLADAKLDALRMQLNPHFLFNTLHAMSALVERDPAGVRKMIARMSELLRRTIDRRAADEVPLRDELGLLQRYIEIMEIRFQGRLRVEQSIDPNVLEALVPNLILQPLVENALEHGVSRIEGEGRIGINASRADDSVVLRVTDNGPGLHETQSGGVGLANTRARLEQLYGDAARVTLTPASGGGVVAELEIPFHTSADLRAEGRDD